MEKLINDFSFGLFFWQILIFVGLLLLLRKFAWKPILEAVNNREEGIKNALESAEEARKEEIRQQMTKVCQCPLANWFLLTLLLYFTREKPLQSLGR